MLEQVNRARANPVAEASLLQALTEPAVVNAYRYFLVDFATFKADMALFPALPPLALSSQLTTAARVHSQWMLDNALQAHDEGVVTPSDRVTATGYPWTIVGESIYAYASNPVHAHASFEVDWGLYDALGQPIAPGMQNPPGHRLNNHNAAFTEAGIGLVRGTNSSVAGGTVGPELYTIDFASRSGGFPYVTGVVHFDLDGDAAYGLGEGLPGVRVDVDGSGYFAVSARSGGYAVPTSDGAHVVTFSAPGMTPVTRQVTVSGGKNVKLDLRLAYQPPAVTGPASPVVGAVNSYQSGSVPGAVAVNWFASRRTPVTSTLGAENGSEGVAIGTSAGYQCVQNLRRDSGNNSYRLTPPDGADQVLRLTNHYAGGTQPSLKFSYLLGYMTPDETLLLEVSDDDGLTWRPVWSVSGHPFVGGQPAPPDSGFTAKTVALGGYVLREFQARFRLHVTPGGSYFPSVTSVEGVFVDSISFTDCYSLADVASGRVAAGTAIPFVPPSTGVYALSVQPETARGLLPLGTMLLVSAVPPPPSIRLAAPVVGPNGKLRLDFQVTGTPPASFVLERVTGLGTAWQADSAAVLSTVSAGNYTFRTDPPAGTGAYYRVRSP